jgi:hypothetical protein
VTVTASDPGGLTAAVTVAIRVTDVDIDYDRDDDHLIDVDSLDKLNAIRWDLDGDGAVDQQSNAANYERAFPDRSDGMGCGAGDHDDDSSTDDQAMCQGYELTADLDFDVGGDGEVDQRDNTYPNWTPIGNYTHPFTAIFDGRGHTISNLSITVTTDDAGLFGQITSTSILRDLYALIDSRAFCRYHPPHGTALAQLCKSHSLPRRQPAIPAGHELRQRQPNCDGPALQQGPRLPRHTR